MCLRSRKINLDKVKASLNILCPKRGCSIAPDKLPHIDFERVVLRMRPAVHPQPQGRIIFPAPARLGAEKRLQKIEA